MNVFSIKTTIASAVAAIAAWKAAKAARETADISRESWEFNLKNYITDRLTDPLEDAQGKALLKYKDGNYYIGHVEIDKYGNIFCKDMRSYKPNYFPGSMPEKNSAFHVPDEFLAKDRSQRLGKTWVNPKDIFAIVFIDSDVKKEVEIVEIIEAEDDNPLE